MIWVGDDWAEDHHDVEIQGEDGRRLARARLPEGLQGIVRLHALIAEHLPVSWSDLDPREAAGRVRIGIETDRGTWVQALLAAGYQVFAINPMSVARYRERHSTSGAKSDQGDAHVLAEIVRLDHAHHRQIAGDSPTAEAVKLVARAHQTLIWDRTRQVLRLRSALREFFPAGRPSQPPGSWLARVLPEPLDAASQCPRRSARGRTSASRVPGPTGNPGRERRPVVPWTSRRRLEPPLSMTTGQSSFHLAARSSAFTQFRARARGPKQGLAGRGHPPGKQSPGSVSGGRRNHRGRRRTSTTRATEKYALARATRQATRMAARVSRWRRSVSSPRTRRTSDDRASRTHSTVAERAWPSES